MTRYSLKDMGLAEKVIDQRAWTQAELSEARQEHLPKIVKLCREKVANGEWEEVCKRNENGRLCKAYRAKGGKR